MFLHLSVSHSVQGGVASQHALGQTPPSLGRHPSGQTPPGRHPRADTLLQTPPWTDTPNWEEPPLDRHPPWTDIPSWANTPPPWADIPPPWTNSPLPSACWNTPPAQCMMGHTPSSAATGVDGTHPTGMHSCNLQQFTDLANLINGTPYITKIVHKLVQSMYKIPKQQYAHLKYYFFFQQRIKHGISYVHLDFI